MFMKKRLFIGISALIFMLLCSLRSSAQDFASNEMKSYLSYCLDARSYVQEKRGDKLLVCIKQISKLHITEFDDMDFISQQPDKELSLDGHVVFTDPGLTEVAEAIINDAGTKYNLHSILRGNEIMLAHRVIPANTTMSYQVLCADLTDVLVFPEKCSEFDIAIKSEDGRLIETCHIDAQTGWGLAKFDIGYMPEPVFLQISNREAEDICCAIAINGE